MTMKIIDAKYEMVFNLILYGLFVQRKLHEGAKMLPYLAPKPKAMEIPNSTCGLMFTKIFYEKQF